MQRIELIKDAVLMKGEGSFRKEGDQLEVPDDRANILVELNIAKKIGFKKKIESAEREIKIENAERSIKYDKPTIRGKGKYPTVS